METLPEQAVNIDEQGIATGQSGTVSQRKRNANRKNAKKSTGPRTARGKEYSRKNAIKHGLFTRHMWEFAVSGEFQPEYDLLLVGFHKQFEPIGKAEELEVERMAVCWWKFQRAWRYENSVALGSCLRAADELKQGENSRKARGQEKKAIVLGLEKIVAELRGAWQVPPDLKDRFFALTSLNEQDWQHFEKMGEESTTAARDPKLAGIFSTPDPPVLRAIHTLNAVITSYELEVELTTPVSKRMALGAYAMPNREDLDKILRYETAIERSLDRALNRLERLQKMRQARKCLDSDEAVERSDTTTDES